MSERNYNVKLDLSKLTKVAAVNLTGRSGEKVKCVVISVEENEIFLSEKGGIYLDLTAIAMKEERYGQTHLIKKSIPSDIYKVLSDEAKKNQPIIGALSPIKSKQAEVTNDMQAEEKDDLPF